MTDEELEQQDKQEQKEEYQEERKKTLKTVITSVICTLLFVVILLLITILCLKNCSPRNNNGDTSSSSSSEPEREDKYDNASLNDIFKEIVRVQALYDLEVNETFNDVLAVTYEYTTTTFSLTIDVRTDNKLYYYSISDVPYTGDDMFTYLLNDISTLPDNGPSVGYLEISSIDTITTDKACKYAISKNALGTVKYLSGFYFENNEFHIYQKKELGSNNPFNEEADQVVKTTDLLYGYYQSLKSN